MSIFNITNHSGGAYGADTSWDLIGRELGFSNHNHYRDTNNPKLSKQLRDLGIEAVLLTSDEMEIARNNIYQILKIKYKDDIRGNLQARNYYQVVRSDAVFAIATLSEDRRKVSGGTNTAVQLALCLDKPVYIWDIDTEQWYEYHGYYFKPCDTPVLTENYAGVGTRDIEDYHVMNKYSGKFEARPQYVGDIKRQLAENAIRKVYLKTLGI